MITNIVTIVAATLFMEAAGESFDGKMAVASVIHNRAVAASQTYDRVCLAPKQFSCWNIGMERARSNISKRLIKKRSPDYQAWLECLQIAALMVDGKFSPTTEADHYFADWIKPPSWAAKMTKLQKVGKHIFFKS